MMKQQKYEVILVSKPLYQNGAHVGNFNYHIDIWGMNSLINEAEVERRLEDFISQLQADWKES